MNSTLDRLKIVLDYVKDSDYFSFINFNIPLFIDTIENDFILNGIIQNLISRYPEIIKKSRELAEIGTINIDGVAGRSLPMYRVEHLKTFEEWVTFAYGYLKYTGCNKGDAIIKNAAIENGAEFVQEEKKSKRQIFYSSFISPIFMYLETKINSSLDATIILRRYKVWCEWYERKKLLIKQETDITRNHLSKYLFDQGYTYTLFETNVPSGRIDNLATSLGIEKTDFSKIPEAIVIEGKIYQDSSSKKVILDVKNQIDKRLNDLNFNEGYCVIFNKTNVRINISNRYDRLNGLDCINVNGKRIFFLIVNLHDDFYESKSRIEDIEIKV